MSRMWRQHSIFINHIKGILINNLASIKGTTLIRGDLRIIKLTWWT